MNLETLLKALAAVGTNLPAFVELYNEAVAVLSPDDQAAAKEALADIQADNDEGHARLQAKLAEAARR